MPRWNARRTTEFTQAERVRRVQQRVQRQEGRSITAPALAASRPRQFFAADNGIVGDGTTDNAPAFSALLDRMRAGDELVLEAGNIRANSAVIVNQSITLRGGATLTTGSNASAQMRVQASNVTIEGLRIVNVGAGTTYQPASYGIRAGGTSVADMIDGLTLRGVTFVEQAGHAFWADFARNIVIEDCRVERFARGAFMFLSCDRIWTQRNLVDTATMPRSPSNVAYGFAFTRDTTRPIAETPRTSNFHCYDNEVRNIPAWEGIDTHAGIYGWIKRNKLSNVFQPIMVGGAKNEAGVDTYGPRYVSIEDNIMESGVDDGTYRPGIIVEGVGPTGGTVGGAISCKVVGNTVIGHGEQAASNQGGIQAYHTDRLTIADNDLDRCSVGGILLINDNKTFIIRDNKIRDVWANADTARPPAIGVTSVNNTGYITGTSTSRGTKVAPRVNERGIYVAAQPGIVIDLGKNPLRGVVARTFGITE